jgi:hypothetical protein
MSLSAVSSTSTLATQQSQQVQHAHHHGHGMRKAGMDAAAQALGMSTSDLQSALKSGQTLATLAQSKGVSTDTLTTAITTALSKANPSLSSDRAAQIAQRMIEGPGAAGASQGAPFAAGAPSGQDPDHDGR